MDSRKDTSPDSKIIPIGPHLRPYLVSEDTGAEAVVIPLRPGLLRRPRQRRTPLLQIVFAGVCWIAVALL